MVAQLKQADGNPKYPFIQSHSHWVEMAFQKKPVLQEHPPLIATPVD